MKQKTSKTKKKRQPASVKTAKPVCGTLSNIAAGRGVTQKAGSVNWTVPPDSIDKMSRK